MKSFDLKVFKENKLFFIITPIIIIGAFVISLFFKTDEYILETEISASGEVDYNKLVINELSSNNKGTIMASDGGLYDWIELYNGKNHDINLTNYSLSDSNDKIKWVFPTGTTIKSKEYLVVFLGGIDESGLIANFKLSSKGKETLVLRNASKKIIDAVDTKPLNGSQVMARDLDGSWQIYKVATPGEVNTSEGYDNYINSLTKEDNPELVINEILPSNKGEFKDSLGEYSGYIEIKNISEKAVLLKEYAISNDKNQPFKNSLPDVLLGSGEIFLIYTSNRNTELNGEYHASFKLANKNGSVILSHLNKLVEVIEYESLANGLALVKNNSEFNESASLSPGYENNKSGIESFQKKHLKTNDGLIISEVMTSNYSYMPHNGGKYYDWIELYNNSNEEISLKDYCLGKDDTSCTNYLPDVKLSAKSYYILMASGDKNLTNNSYTHLDFKLSSNDGLYLFKDKKIVDSLFIPKLNVGYSYGKSLKEGVYYYSSPTPKEANNNGILAITLPPTFNTVGGIYNNTTNLEVTLKGEGSIYYTTDGSNPSVNSTRYINKIVLNKTTVIKAIAVAKEEKASEVVTSSYIINENHTVPVISVSLSPEDFSYINHNAWVTGIEKEAYIEYYDEKGSFSEPCGLKLFGGTTRGPAKKSYAIKFRKSYGEGTLNYQVFDNRDYSTFDSLVLRTGSQDEQATGITRAMIRDILGTSLVDGVTEINVQAYKTSVLYVNGKYWGIYFIREKIDQDYVANNYNLNNTEDTDLLRIDGEVKSGSKSSYNELVNYMNTHDLANDEYYNYVASKIDITSIIDFWVAESYVTNNDIVNCRYFRNLALDDGKWKFIFYDLDWAWYNYDYNYYKFATSSEGMTVKGYTTVLLRNLMKNESFKNEFVKRVSYQLKNVWNKDRIYKYMDNILNELEPELQRNYDRWGYSMSEHETSLKELKEYIEKRETYMEKQTKSFFDLSDKEMKEYFGE